MYCIMRWIKDGDVPDIFGPFPTEGRANDYALQFDTDIAYHWTVMSIIVPNCVQVKLAY